MSRKLFGTDGVRGKANTAPMTADMALRIGAAAGRYFRRENGGVHRVVIGKDTRRSGYMFETALTAGLTSTGMSVLLLGPVPTPAVGLLTPSMRADVGIMISASHNPAEDNGIKFFGPDGFKLNDEAEAEIERLEKRIDAIPFIDTYDLRYHQLAAQPQPSSQAVMFCVMDVSGSMTQNHKDIAKRFFLLLYLFLEKHYEKVELVFVRHHTAAREVNEEEFFYSRETGGTIVSSALNLVNKIIEKRYPAGQWNLYVAQASDGDNWDDDSNICRDLLVKQLMPQLQYYAYVEITPHDHQSLWHEYEAVAAQFPERFAMRQIVDAGAGQGYGT